MISSSVIGVPSGLGSSVGFHSLQRAFALALQCCSFSSGSQPELFFLAGFMSSFGSCPFSLGSQALIFSSLGTFVAQSDSCSFALSCQALFPLLASFVGAFDGCPFAFSCEALFPLLAGFVGQRPCCPFFLLLERSTCTPFPDIFSSKTFSSLSFVILSKLYKSDEASRHFRATFTSPSRHRHRQTNFHLESSALRATLIFTSPSRVSPPTKKLVPRKLGAPRLAGDPCSEYLPSKYLPSNEGELN